MIETIFTIAELVILPFEIAALVWLWSQYFKLGKQLREMQRDRKGGANEG